MTQSCDVHASTNVYILVAEDDPIVQMVVKNILEQAGYKADFVADGKEVLNALEVQDYDLIVMDCFMPHMDGFTTTRFIRNTDSTGIRSGIPIIAMTGLTAKDDQRRCLDAGMDDYVCKPVDAHTLISVIERSLGRAKGETTVLQQNDTQTGEILEDNFLNTIIDKFLEEVPQVIIDLQAAAECGDAATLQHIGHRLRGATDILEASTLSVHALALEQAGKDGNTALASKLASELIKELQKLLAALTE